MSQLDQLAQHRDTILLAEAVGWLHDYRKCSEEQLQVQSANTTAQGIAHTELTNRFASLNSVSLMFTSVTEQVLDLLNQPKGQANNLSASFFQQYLARCHNTAHFDKQEPLKSGKQNFPGTQISTAFGFETVVGANLTTQLWSLPWNDFTTLNASNRHSLLTSVQTLFATVGADTRRPINEINLWDWGMLVGAFYKTAVAAVILGHQPANRDLRWQLLGVRTDALTYLTNVSRLPDLEARKNTLQVAIENVKMLLEETYPLAAEVYRDENGSLYVVPELTNLLGLQDGNDQTLLGHIQEQFATDGEIVPDITLDPTPWWGQDPDRNGNDEMPPAGAMLLSQATLQSDVYAIGKTWEGKRQEVCPVCGLRPCVSKQVDYCQICGERRKGRVAEWLQNQSKTIWLDEVADRNGRLALITGTFDLTNWLDGLLVETLLVQEPANDTAVSKNSSFARLRRIWQTTQTFWQEAQASTNQTLTDARRRLTVKLANPPDLQANQTYELDLHGRSRMSVLWDGQHLISTDNLSYTAVQLGIKPEEHQTPADAALAVGTWLDSNKQKVFQLISDDEKNRRFDIQIADIDYQDAEYAAAIPILAQPRTFMALVPADKALDIAAAIQTKYEREMGKVRNRLPLHLGLVYFHRRTPLRAALDAGRRMLRYEVGGMKDEVWTVQGVRCLSRDESPEKLVKETKHFDLTVAVTLNDKNGRSLTWHVPNVMGDGITPDNWYPYVFIQGEVNGHSLTFKAPRPKPDGKTEECWLILASQLQAGDQIYFTPATLDFQWLDSTARRFEIAYDKNGRRCDHLTRPYLLDQLDEIEEAWGMLQSLSKNQLYALRDVIEQKRAAWFIDPQDSLTNETFTQFCADVVRNTKWKTTVDLKKLTNWAITGLLANTIQLHVSIMKKDLQTEKQPHE
ncbi:MAG: CRISPR-associated protein Csx11 [Chloroflexi bacterium]|nr:CRISPR-associated protein Csx11 [Chloroflexota bacterium]